MSAISSFTIGAWLATIAMLLMGVSITSSTWVWTFGWTLAAILWECWKRFYYEH